MKVLVVGAAILDIVMKLERLPKTGDDIACESTSSNVGGCAYNVASLLQKYKVEHDLLVPVGKGTYGTIIKNDLEANGYEILAYNDSKDNGYCLCLVEKDGERSFITVKGAEGEFDISWFENLNSSDYDAIYISGYQVMGEAGKIISNWLYKNKFENIYFAPGPLIPLMDQEVLNKIFACKPIIHLNEKEINEFTEEFEIEKCINKLYDLSQNTVIVTLGSDGAMYYDGKDIVSVEGFNANVVDTIGAGDSHIASIIASMSKNIGLEESIRQANKVASKVVSTYGPILSIEDFNNIK